MAHIQGIMNLPWCSRDVKIKTKNKQANKNKNQLCSDAVREMVVVVTFKERKHIVIYYFIDTLFIGQQTVRAKETDFAGFF